MVRLAIVSAARFGWAADTAPRFARTFGTTAKLWPNLQQSYDLAVTERDHGEAIVIAVRPRVA